jgi:hypothetical protein
MNKTRKNRGQGVATRGWKQQKPGYHQKTVMLSKCGKKCFLGENKSFPICKKNTCKISKQGLYAAYIRARQYRNKSSKYGKIAKKAEKMLVKIHAKR